MFETNLQVVSSEIQREGILLSKHLKVFEHTCAYARWAHMHRFLSVCLVVCHLPNFESVD